MPTTVCTYKLMKNEFAKSMKPSPIKLYNMLSKKKKTFTQTRNVKSLSNKHLRLTLLISLTSNYGLTYTTSQVFEQ